MNTIQIWLTIGIPSVLVILSWLQNNARAARQEAISDQRFAQIHADLTSLATETRTGLATNARETAALKDLVYREMVGLHERVTVIESKQS